MLDLLAVTVSGFILDAGVVGSTWHNVFVTD